ncbi:MAG: hypothetical protein J6A63_06245 [Clostridia bacterium]|nr:hypothetical protein [Clostridia bacterium]
MKLEKREISLNETDSLFDALCTENMLLISYAQGLQYCTRKQSRDEILRLMHETGKDVTYIKDLLSDLQDGE